MYDYHLHSSFSDDSETPMEDMVKAAISKGITEIAITDHYDPYYPDEEMPFILDLPNYHKELNRIVDQYEDRIKIAKGIELGIQNGETINECYEIASSFDYDFIIGSFHAVNGVTTYQGDDYKNSDYIGATEDYYQYMYECLREFNDYDVLGHINAIDRYIEKVPGKKYYMDIVEEILKLLVDNGKGLEINTSSFRYDLGERTMPPLDMLKLYVDLGGEIITTGSDAHTTDYVGNMLDYAQDMILKTGHKYVATFHNRKLIQIKI